MFVWCLIFTVLSTVLVLVIWESINKKLCLWFLWCDFSRLMLGFCYISTELLTETVWVDMAAVVFVPLLFILSLYRNSLLHFLVLMREQEVLSSLVAWCCWIADVLCICFVFQSFSVVIIWDDCLNVLVLWHLLVNAFSALHLVV